MAIDKYGELDESEKQARFVCPGCGEDCTAKNGILCGECHDFVHYECLVKIIDEFGWPNLSVFGCPICKTQLCAGEVNRKTNKITVNSRIKLIPEFIKYLKSICKDKPDHLKNQLKHFGW